MNLQRILFLSFFISLFILPLRGDVPSEKIVLKVFALPSNQATTPQEFAEYRIVQRFRELHPEVDLQTTSALRINESSSVADIAPLMSIAGGTSADVLNMFFRQSDTYIQKGFLYPLDEYIKKMSPEELKERVSEPVFPVIHRDGPGGSKHYWMLPYMISVKVLLYRRDMFFDAGLDPERPPKDWTEFHEYARKLTDPSKGMYGTGFFTSQSMNSWYTNPFIDSAGAKILEELPNGDWKISFDSKEAVDSFEFIDLLQKDTVTKNNKTSEIAYRGEDMILRFFGQNAIAMAFGQLNSGLLSGANLDLFGIAPVPKGPSGKSSGQIGGSLMGIFAGQKDKKVRDAAWEYIRFFDSEEARQIYTDTLVELGEIRSANPKWLRKYGYPQLANLSLPGLEETFEYSLAHGTPEAYGKNCQLIYHIMSKPMEQIYYNPSLGKMVREEKRAKIKEYLSAAVKEANEKMIGIIPKKVRAKRDAAAWVLAVGVMGSFVFVLWRIFYSLSLSRPPVSEKPPSYKMRLAVLLISPAVLLILMWQYYPLLRGSLMAFQDYHLIGKSIWIGISNFADVVFEPDHRFLLALKNSFYFCFLWMLMGFFPPLILAVILQEIPRFKIFFRVLFYLPAVVSGGIILFMWRAIYDPSPDGVLNKILDLFHWEAQKWLVDPQLAMICVVFPLAWAHLGPGCLIYLAALKGIPDELYEAADIDGASFFEKLRHIVVPYLKPLLVINMVGAIVYGFKSSDAVLAMTGGGPNLATQVAGYEIWERSFMFLKFGQGTAMAWILGLILLTFTAYQLRILNKVEFRTANR